MISQNYINPNDDKNRVRVWPFRFWIRMTILLSGSRQKPVFSFSGSGTGSTQKNPGFQIAGSKPEKLDGGWNDEASVHAPLDFLEFAETIKMKNKFMRYELNLPTSMIKFTIAYILCVKTSHLAVHNNKKLNKYRSIGKSGLAVSLRCRLRHRQVQEAAAMKAASKV